MKCVLKLGDGRTTETTVDYPVIDVKETYSIISSIDPLGIISTISTKGDSGAWEKLALCDDVNLGQEVKITFNSRFKYKDFGIENCVASWGNRTLAIVSNGFIQTGTDSLSVIDPQVPSRECKVGAYCSPFVPGHFANFCSNELTFKQFAIGENASNRTFSFHLECEIVDAFIHCPQRRGSGAPGPETIVFDYRVNANNDDVLLELDDSIIIRELDKEIKEDSTSVTKNDLSAALVPAICLVGLALLMT